MPARDRDADDPTQRSGPQLPSEMLPGDWALRICQELGADAYINPASGRHLYDEHKFAEAGIDISFFDPDLIRYNTDPFPFEPGLSVNDTLMWLDPSTDIMHEPT